MSNTAWNHQKGKIQLQIEYFVGDLNLVIDHSPWERIHTGIHLTQKLQNLLQLAEVFGKHWYHFSALWEGYWRSALQSQLTMFSMQNTTCKMCLLVTNALFSCRTALPTSQAIRMGASCFGLAGKCEAIAASSSFVENNGLTWKLSCLLSVCLFPGLQAKSWIVGWQHGFHLHKIM